MVSKAMNEDPTAQQAPPRKGFPWFRAGFFVVCVGAVAFMFSPYRAPAMDEARDLVRAWRTNSGADEAARWGELDDQNTEANDQEDALPPARVRRPLVPSELSGGDVIVMNNGITYESDVIFIEGEPAAIERQRSDAYVARYELKVKVPKPATTLAELEQQAPDLGKVLPGLEALLKTAAVSPYFDTLYENKARRVKRSAESLRKLLSRHNFYDCQTILHLRNAENDRRVLLLQGDMDVVSDGSDGDRLAEMPEDIVNSTHYQPFTSYGWRKTTDRPNPMVAGWERRIENANRELADASTTSERRVWLEKRKQMLQRGIDDMKARSFLIAEYDPFIVIPVNVLTDDSRYSVKPGDYAVVVHDGQVYPAIVGDGGPTFKIGEASLRMAKQLNPRASPYSRPVSDLAVTYIVFPRTRGDRQAPDYDLWREKCAELLDEIGGLGEGIELYKWENLLPAE